MVKSISECYGCVARLIRVKDGRPEKMQLDSMFLSFYSPAIVGYPCQMATGQQFWGMALEEIELVRERSSFKLRVAQDESQFRKPSLAVFGAYTLGYFGETNEPSQSNLN